MKELIYKAQKHSYILLFSLFFFIYLSLGLAITFQNQSITECFDILFGADCPRVYYDLFTNCYGSDRISVHPLQLILLQPIIKIIYAIINSQRASVLILNSIVVSSILLLIKSISYNITNNKTLSLYTALVFGISFGTLFFASIPEVYIFSCLFDILLLHYLIDIYKNNKPLDNTNITAIALLNLFSFGLIAINLITGIVLTSAYLFLICNKDIKNTTKYSLKIFTLVLIGYIILTPIQKLAYPGSLIFLKNSVTVDKRYTTFNHSFKDKFPTLIANVTESFYCINVKHKEVPKLATKLKQKRTEVIITSPQQNPLNYAFILFFILSAIISYIYRERGSRPNY